MKLIHHLVIGVFLSLTLMGGSGAWAQVKKKPVEDKAAARHGIVVTDTLGSIFDWARFDPNQDHVYSARAFAGKLEDSFFPF